MHLYRTMFNNHYILLLLITVVFTFTAPVKSGAKGLSDETPILLDKKIAILPFDNFSDEKNALNDVMPFLKSRLEEKGLEVVDRDSLNNFLCKERVRSTGYISKELAKKIEEEFMVEAIMVGSIFLYSGSGIPKFGITARLIDASNNTIIWADYNSATGDDFAKILGLGEIKTIYELIPKVVDTLLSSFTTEPYYKEIKPAYKIAVMPFQNYSGIRGGGIIATYLFLTELLKNHKFIPVEYGMVREMILENRIYSKGELDYKSMKILSDALKVDAILLGTMETYRSNQDASSPPEVTVSARLLNAHNNKIEWYSSYQLDGEDDIIMFDWGRLKSADKVAEKVVTKLLDNMEKKEF